MTTKLIDEVDGIVFEDGVAYKDIVMLCKCGRPIVKFVGFRVYRNQGSMTSVVCACEVGHENVVEIADTSGTFSDGQGCS